MRVYIETTIVRYLAAKPSRDLILAARQAVTEQSEGSRPKSGVRVLSL